MQPTQNSTIITSLTELGLGPNEAMLYEILLKNPNATIPTLTKASQMTRTMVYYVLNNLIGLELAQTAKEGKKTTYNAAPPEKLEDFLADQEKELQRQKNALKGIVSDLGSLYRLSHNKPGIKFYEGAEGIRDSLEDSLTSTEPILTYMDMDSMDKTMRDANAEYVKKRLKKGIQKHLLIIDSPSNREMVKNYDQTLTKIKFLPKKIHPFKTGMQIYDNKISFFTHRLNNTISVIIQDQDLYEMNKSIFNFFWENYTSSPTPLPTSGDTVFNN